MGRRGALIVLKYVHSFTDRHGKERHYYRRNGKRTPLLGEPGSREFMDAYAAALASQKPPATPRPQTAPRTFGALAPLYYASGKYRKLSVTSRGNYRRVIDGFLEKHGHRRVDQMRLEHVDAIMGEMSDRPGAAIILLKRIRTLIRYAIKLGWITHNPTHEATTYDSKEIHTWNDDEIAAFEVRWPIGSRQRLAYTLLLYTGQRGSDVHRMTWRDISGDAIRVEQKKTKQADDDEELLIPMHPALLQVLSATKRSNVAILTTEYGAPFSVKGFGNLMSAAIRAAGLPTRCKAHGLRKAAARRLAEAGASEKQIGSITGHKSLEEIARYTRKANQPKLARGALAKQLENEELANHVATRHNTALQIN